MRNRVAEQVDIVCRGAIFVIAGVSQRRPRIEADDAGRAALEHGNAGTGGIQFLGVNLKKPMKRVLKGIKSGKFANEWKWEQRTGKLRYRLLKELALRQPVLRMEDGVRKSLGLI